jgi:hypothetical protein
MSLRGVTLTEEVQLVTETCCACGALFAMSTEFQQQRRRDRSSFYCPAGHGQHYTGKPTEQQLREQAEWLEQQLASREEDLRAERVSHAATKGQLTKTRKRVGNGVCPCCHRSFQQLARHMSGQHPEYVEVPL